MTPDPNIGTATDDPATAEAVFTSLDAALLDPLLARIRPGDAVAAADAAWDRLLDPDDTAWLGHHPGLHLLAAHTLHTGTAT